MPTINASKYGYLVQSSTTSFTALRNGTTALQVVNDFVMYLEVKVASGNYTDLTGLLTLQLILQAIQ